MNIKKAKEQIKSAMTAYFTKDPLGNYVIPIEKQRPVFLVGPPGIGKTAIMEQIASELGVGLLSYSMTHHTRQSAIGLPYISHKEYAGKDLLPWPGRVAMQGNLDEPVGHNAHGHKRDSRGGHRCDRC